AVVYQIVQAHEGKVWARSKPGQGTTFVLRLRRFDAERQTDNASSVGSLVANTARPQLVATAGSGRARG
ncbi:MAG: ATP-binding protein, partial [Candidatus Sulfotelmatobacter sp.]